MENKRRNKTIIIISIVMLSLISLILLGVTYAYYRARIAGNKNNSLVVQSSKIKIEYSDDKAVVEALDMDPGDSISKTFSVKNSGNKKTSFNIILENISNGFSREDWIYEIYEGAEVLEDKTNLLTSGKIPLLKSFLGMMQNVEVDTEVTNTYTFVLTYPNLEEDQSIDMGKKLSFKINISETTILDQAPSGTLLSAIGRDNAISEPVTPIGKNITQKEWGLIESEDDYGRTYYYRGGNNYYYSSSYPYVSNNYVSFAGMCWRIVRVQGDGSIKLVLREKDNAECNVSSGGSSVGTANFGYTSITNDAGATVLKASFLNPQTDSENSIINVLKNFEYTLAKRLNATVENERTAIAEVLNTKLKNGGIVYNNNPYDPESLVSLTEEEHEKYYKENKSVYYDQYIRLVNNNYPSFKSKNLILDTYVDDDTPMFASILSMDDLVFAGIQRGGSEARSSYIKATYPSHICWWIMDINRFVPKTETSNKAYDQVLCIDYNGVQFGKSVDYLGDVRPSITLKNNVLITGGIGTMSDPYVISIG